MSRIKKSETSQSEVAPGIEKKKSPQKKKTSQGKKVISKNYAGDDVVLLAKEKYNKTIAMINVVETIDETEMEKFLLAVAMGMIPDKFGLEAGLDVRLKAFDQLQKLKQAKAQNPSSSEEDDGVVIVDDIS